jgi:cellulose synthase/poly-beta-1,6-N-acetylglucosamine synthase-like glycosyltransferase
MLDEEEVAQLFFERITPILQNITENYEIICVDDGSTDSTLEILKSNNLDLPGKSGGTFDSLS